MVVRACLRCDEPLAEGERACASCAAEGRALGMPLLGVVVEGRYTVVNRLRMGPAATVWAAFDGDRSNEVVLKELRPQALLWEDGPERFYREARALMRIDHDAIVRLVDLVEIEGRPCLVLERVEGVTLRRRLALGKPIPLDEALGSIAELADGLHVAHRAGIVHRDVKPENIILAEEEGITRPKLLDFGIAHIERSLSITGDDQLVGTPGYLAPEYVREGTSDALVDVYALGVTLYEMLTLELPHSAASPMELIRKQCTMPPTPPRVHVPALPEDVDALVLRAIALAREERFPTMLDFRDAAYDVASRVCR